MHSSVDEIVEDGKKNNRYEAHEEKVSKLESRKNHKMKLTKLLTMT